MPRYTRLLVAGILPAVAVAALNGCSSSGDSASPTTRTTTSGSGGASGTTAGGRTADAGKVHDRLDYTGERNGGFDVTSSVACATLSGKLVAVTSPDPADDAAPAQPSFSASIGAQTMATLVTPDKHTFVRVGADGVSAAKKNGTWTVTLAGTELGSTDAAAGTVTAHGTLVCTTVTGT